MNDEQKEWLNQFSSNIGGKEVFRLICAISIWAFVGVVITVAINITLGITFLMSMFMLPFLIRWRPIYLFIRTILGNKNLPLEPMHRSTIKFPRQSLPWWGYLPGLWFLLLDLIIFYIIIKKFFLK